MKYPFAKYIMNNLRFLNTNMCNLLLDIIYMFVLQLLTVFVQMQKNFTGI